MDYEWDEKKRISNIESKGVDFEEASASAFEWAKATHEPDMRCTKELRLVSFAPVHGRIYALCWTQRGDKVRIINFRKANKREVKKYEQTR